jgi:putative signal transducing protein
MRNLLQTHSISWAESVRIVLESEGIEAVVLDGGAPGYLGFAGRTRVAVLNDDDLPKAQEILRRLQPPKMPTPPSWRWQKRGLICLGLGFFGIGYGVASLDPYEGVPLKSWVSFVAGWLLLVGGFTLIALGPRADKKENQPEP